MLTLYRHCQRKEQHPTVNTHPSTTCFKRLDLQLQLYQVSATRGRYCRVTFTHGLLKGTLVGRHTRSLLQIPPSMSIGLQKHTSSFPRNPLTPHLPDHGLHQAIRRPVDRHTDTLAACFTTRYLQSTVRSTMIKCTFDSSALSILCYSLCMLQLTERRPGRVRMLPARSCLRAVWCGAVWHVGLVWCCVCQVDMHL